MHQFPVDVFTLVPKPRTGNRTPWIILPDMAKQWNVGLFKSFGFSRIFRMAQYRRLDDKRWEELIFNRYFPRQGETDKAGLQGFPTAKYYRRWKGLLEEVDTPRAETVRRLVLKWFQKLWWLPLPGSDRMWEIRTTTQPEWIMVPPGEPQSCPKLAINEVHWSARKHK